MRRLVGLALALLVLGVPAVVLADEPIKTAEFVYSVTASDGNVYRSTFAPVETDAIYLLADVPNVLSPRETFVYYWPLDREFKADWLKGDRLMSGTLQIMQGGTVLQSLSLEQYVTQTPTADWQTDVVLYTGPAAGEAYQRYQADQDAYWASARAFSQAESKYEGEMASLGESGADPNAPAPVAPVRPAAPTLDSVQPNSGYIVNLPVGQYDIRVVNDQNQIWPGSQHTLDVIAPRRTGIGYMVVPADRWTTPYSSDDPDTVIYVTRPMTVYLEPFSELEFNQAGYKRLLDPQDGSGREDTWTWVHTKPVSGDTLQVTGGGKEAASVATEPYYVKQLPTAALGYTVLAYDPATMPGVHPSFNAFQLQVDPASGALQTYLSADNAAPVPASARQIHVVNAQNDWTLLLPGPIVLLLGLAYRLRRGWLTRARSSRVTAK